MKSYSASLFKFFLQNKEVAKLIEEEEKINNGSLRELVFVADYCFHVRPKSGYVGVYRLLQNGCGAKIEVEWDRSEGKVWFVENPPAAQALYPYDRFKLLIENPSYSYLPKVDYSKPLVLTWVDNLPALAKPRQRWGVGEQLELAY